jgi:oxygen-dependent protoporphyrinogen oxidase
VTVLVVGGGITGLASAYALGKEGIPTLLVEGADRLGGKVRTEAVDGFLIEHGPDSFVGYRPAGVQLARELGLGDAIVQPQEPRVVFIRAGGQFRRFPDGMGLVLPTRLWPFVRSDLFAPMSKARMALDLLLPRDGSAGDVAVGPFLRRRLGNALVDRLAGPLIVGVYGTSIDELSVDAVVPQLRASERNHRSLLLAAFADARGRRAASKGGVGASFGTGLSAPFVSLAGGTEQLVDSLTAALRAMPEVEIRTSTLIDGLDIEGSRLRARIRGGERVTPEAVILAAPAGRTAAILEGLVPGAAAHIRSIPHGETAVVNLAYGDDQLPEHLPGHGFLVARDEPLTINAATLSSRKWAGRAPRGTLLVRAFIGDTRANAHAKGDAALVATAHQDLAATLGVRGEPLLSRISRYPAAMPKYTVGHLDRVAAAEAALVPYPAVRIAGGAYRGVGLPDCISQGRAAAEAIADLLSGGAGQPNSRESAGGQAHDSAQTRPGLTLDALPVGLTARVVSISGGHDSELALEGLLPGTAIAVSSRSPFRGPLVVGVGRSLVAVARGAASEVTVEIVTEATAPVAE